MYSVLPEGYTLTALTSQVAKTRARVAGLSRDRDPNDPVFVDAKRDLMAATLEAHVERVLAKAPPLTDEQAERIAAHLRGGEAS